MKRAIGFLSVFIIFLSGFFIFGKKVRTFPDLTRPNRIIVDEE